MDGGRLTRLDSGRWVTLNGIPTTVTVKIPISRAPLTFQGQQYTCKYQAGKCQYHRG
jgi:hypothetical protein